MDGGDFPWNSRLSTSSRRHQSRSEIYLGGDDAVEVEDDYKQEFLCPFCADEFDIVGLYSHVDEEHPVELKQGRRRRLRRGGSSAMFNMLRKELKEASRQSMFGGHSYTSSASNPDLDPLLSSLVYSSPIVEEPGEWKNLSFVRRIRRRRLASVSLYRGYCSPPCLMTFYNPGQQTKGTVLCN